MANGTMIFTTVREGQTSEVTGVQMRFVSGANKWESRMLSPSEFVELMLHSEVFPPPKAESLVQRVREQGQITEENVAITHELMHFLGLHLAK